MDGHGRLTGADRPSTVFGHSDAVLLDLSFARFPPQLSDQLVDLGQPGCTNGMPTGYQPSAGIHRDFTVQGSRSAFRKNTAFAYRALIGASVLHSIGLSLPVFGTIAAFLLAAAAFAAILGTGFLRGIGIAVLHAVFSWLLALVIGAVLGVGAISLFTIF